MNSSTPIVILPLMAALCSCTVTTKGGYLIGKGSNELLEPVHAAAATALVPTLDKNNCILEKPIQDRSMTTQDHLLEKGGKTIENRHEYNYEFRNKCR